MKKIISILLFSVFIFTGCDNLFKVDKKNDNKPGINETPNLPNSGYTITLDFHGPSVSPNTVYVCWVEDESGTCLQNIYVCNREMGITGSLTGTALPYWKKNKYTVMNNVDGVTGASVQGSTGLNVTRDLKIGTVQKFHVCFEIDRSTNNNTYFKDRPAFIYKSGLIDLGSLSSSPYNLSLYGWMSDETTGDPYGQDPRPTTSIIPGWLAFKLFTDLSYIQPDNDMVNTLTATIAIK